MATRIFISFLTSEASSPSATLGRAVRFIPCCVIFGSTSFISFWSSYGLFTILVSYEGFQAIDYITDFSLGEIETKD